jgi:hypothetical protein
MVLQRRSALVLLVVAIGAVGYVATSRIVAAANSGPVCMPRVICTTPKANISPAAAAALLANLATPAGFTRGPCSQFPGYGYTVCFRRARSVVLTPAFMAALVADLHVKLLGRSHGISWPTPSSCQPQHKYSIQHATTPRLNLIACNLAATVGAQQLNVAATSFVIADAKAMTSTTRGSPPVPGGSQIAVTDYGRWGKS